MLFSLPIFWDMFFFALCPFHPLCGLISLFLFLQRNQQNPKHISPIHALVLFSVCNCFGKFRFSEFLLWCFRVKKFFFDLTPLRYTASWFNSPKCNHAEPKQAHWSCSGNLESGRCMSWVATVPFDNTKAPQWMSRRDQKCEFFPAPLIIITNK